MEPFPQSPEDVIDPRWARYLHAGAPAPSAPPESTAQLSHAMREIIEPWQQGLRGSRETLAALCQLAERIH
jgi:hypothetical protein